MATGMDTYSKDTKMRPDAAEGVRISEMRTETTSSVAPSSTARSPSRVAKVDGETSFLPSEAKGLGGARGPSTYTEADKEVLKDARKKDITRAYTAIKNSSQIDLAFLVDCTGSMSPWIEAIREKIYLLFQKQKVSMPPDASLHAAFVGYTDFDVAQSSRFKVLDFTSSSSDIRSFLSGVSAGGGGDGPEDVFGGFQQLFQLKWRSQSTKVLIHIADYPCHGTNYHDGLPDDHTNPSEWAFPSHVPIMVKLGETNVQYWFGYITKNTDKMIATFDVDYFAQTEQHIQRFDAKDPGTVIKSAYVAVTESVATSSAAAFNAEGKKTHVERKYTIDASKPDWASIPKIIATAQKQLLPRSVDDMRRGSPQYRKITVSIKKAPNPFARGGVRLAYHGLEFFGDGSSSSRPGTPAPADGKLIVLKESRYLGEKVNSKKRYLEDMETQTVAAFFAKLFNETATKKPTIKFNVAKLIQLSGTKPVNMALETLLEGDYKKFNNNTGIVLDPDDDISQLMQCFSHFTWEKSEHYLIVVDLQGVPLSAPKGAASKGAASTHTDDTGRGYLLTDPAIHCLNILRFGRTNMGNVGVQRFFSSHICSHWCTELSLPKRSGTDIDT